MYSITVLLIINVFEKRHSDITPDPALAFGLIGICVLFTAIHSYTSSTGFWVAFLVVDVVVCLSIAVFYYLSGDPLHKKMYPSCTEVGGNRPLLTFVSLILVIHWVILIIAVALEPDFATFVLGILVLNFLLYLGYYLLMKLLFDKESFKDSHAQAETGAAGSSATKVSAQELQAKQSVWKPAILFLVTIALAVVAIYFFALPTSDKNQLPMLSRNLNTDCVIMDFYDTHDIWHFFAGAGLFSASLSLLYIDVDLTQVQQAKIKSF